MPFSVLNSWLYIGLRQFCAVLLLLAAVDASAAELEQFSTEQLRQRYLALIDDLRCPQCQNQNLSDSDSPIAQDLRRTVLRMLEEGNSDQQVIDYLIDRYGDFIIYMPRFKPGTYALWLLPVGLAVLGLLVIVLIVRRQRSSRTEVSLDATEQQRLDTLLDKQQMNNKQAGSSGND